MAIATVMNTAVTVTTNINKLNRKIYVSKWDLLTYNARSYTNVHQYVVHTCTLSHWKQSMWNRIFANTDDSNQAIDLMNLPFSSESNSACCIFLYNVLLVCVCFFFLKIIRCFTNPRQHLHTICNITIAHCHWLRIT